MRCHDELDPASGPSLLEEMACLLEGVAENLLTIDGNKLIPNLQVSFLERRKEGGREGGGRERERESARP